jgi:UDP-2-acetamido-3-amino-2,3-dideoxy-glucuronate N-acetyltransferase
VFTNVTTPRAEVDRRGDFEATVVREGATLGANCTIVCGVTVGRYAFVGAGAVVTRDVPDHAEVVGVPARRSGWRCACGDRLKFGDDRADCPSCGRAYRLADDRETVALEA